MLGTNDCKTRYGASASVIARGLDQVIRKARLNASQHFDLLVVSPIHLGHGVGEADFDPEFDERSEVVSRNLANEYRKVALQNHAAFLNAADLLLQALWTVNIWMKLDMLHSLMLFMIRSLHLRRDLQM